MSNEWYTPAKYIEAARTVMGGIDLDPASCEMANQVVRAARYYTQEENGLMQTWYGRVWLNPPYGVADPRGNGRYKGGGSSLQNRSLQVLFVQKGIKEYKAGNVEQLIMLVTANITIKWFQPLLDYPLCIPYPKISFTVPGETEGQRQVFGNAVIYLGSNEAQFIEVFSRFGRIVRAIDTPSVRPVARELWEGIA